MLFYIFNKFKSKNCFFQNKNCYKTRIESKMYLTLVCNSWSIFQEGGTKFVPLETRAILLAFHRLIQESML